MRIFYILLNICLPYCSVVIPIYTKNGGSISMFCFIIPISSPTNLIYGSISRCYIQIFLLLLLEQPPPYHVLELPLIFFLPNLHLKCPMASLVIPPPLELLHFLGHVILQFVLLPLELLHQALLLSFHPNLIPLYLLDYHMKSRNFF